MNIIVHPFEVIFHKTFWKMEKNFVYYDETIVYMDWVQKNGKNISAN
jgi:hypothetical protein